MSSGSADSRMVFMRKNIIQRIVKIILMFFLFFLGSGYYNIYLSKFLEARNLVNAMKDYAENMNGECPINIANRDVLIIEKIYYKEKKTVVYEYLVNYNLDSIDIELFENKMPNSIIEELEMLDSLEIWRNRGVVFEYIFFDNKKEEISRFSILYNTPLKIIE
jgi:hypothetical protein